MTACGPGSSKPIRQHADEVRSSLTAPAVGRGLARDATLQDGRQAGDRAEPVARRSAAGDRRRRTDSGWHWSTLFASGAATPPSRRTNVDDESLPAAIVSSCTLAARRSRVSGACASCAGLWRVPFKVISKRTSFVHLHSNIWIAAAVGQKYVNNFPRRIDRLQRNVLRRPSGPNQDRRACTSGTHPPA